MAGASRGRADGAENLPFAGGGFIARDDIAGSECALVGQPGSRRESEFDVCHVAGGDCFGAGLFGAGGAICVCGAGVGAVSGGVGGRGVVQPFLCVGDGGVCHWRLFVQLSFGDVE